jgi:integrase
MRLRQRGNTWYGVFYENGRWVALSTRCQDKKAAETRVRQWERDAADPDHAAARTATLSDALKLLLLNDEELISVGRRSPYTLDFHKAKAGHLVRVFETDDRSARRSFLLGDLRARHVDAYVSQRRSEGAVEYTIAKELFVLRKSLRLAVRAGLWRGRVEEVIPVSFSTDYKPRERALTGEELEKLLAQLEPDRAACVAFIVATSACWGEAERAEREDVANEGAVVHVRGTKRETRDRGVPMVFPFQVSLLAYAQQHAAGTEGMLFTPWSNVRRGLIEACKRAGILPCSPNDLRRTFANWMVAADVPLFLVAQMMGHKDTRMLERVYGRQRPEQLARSLSRLLQALMAQSTASPHCHTGVTAPVEFGGFRGLAGLLGMAVPPVPAAAPGPKNNETPHTFARGASDVRARMSVPGPGIEPGTRGFSVPCSTS